MLPTFHRDARADESPANGENLNNNDRNDNNGAGDAFRRTCGGVASVLTYPFRRLFGLCVGIFSFFCVGASFLCAGAGSSPTALTALFCRSKRISSSLSLTPLSSTSCCGRKMLFLSNWMSHLATNWKATLRYVLGKLFHIKLTG